MPGFEWDLAEVIQDSDCLKSTSKDDRRRLLGCANKSLLEEKTTFSSATAVTRPRASAKPQSKLNPLALDRRPDGNPKQGMGNGSLKAEMNGLGSKGEGDPPHHRVLFPKENLEWDWESCKIWDVKGQSIPVRHPGAGLHNPGSYCYINAALNCLTYTVPLTNYLLSMDHKKSCKSAHENSRGALHKGPRRDKGFGQSNQNNKMNVCSMCLMTYHVNECLTNTGRTITPILHNYLRNICPNFKGDNQEDAQEYMQYLLNHMDADDVKLHGTVDQATAATSVINQIFSGVSQSEVECRTCHHKSATTQVMREITLDIKAVTSLELALERHYQPVILKEDNAYKCERCKACKEAVKSELIKEPPVILTFLLKRFSGDLHKMSKLIRNVRVEEVIDMRRYTSQKKGEPVRYKLYALMVHEGHTVNCGHYYAFCRGPDNKWYTFNDTLVQEVSKEHVLSNGQGYILLYQRMNIGNGPSSTKEAHNDYQNHQKVKAINGFHVDPMKHGASSNGKKKNLLSGMKPKPQFGEMNCRLPAVSQASTSKTAPLPEKRDKVSFGMRDLSNRPATVSQPSTSKSTPLPEKREKVSFGMRPSVILQINHGMDAPADKTARTPSSRTVERCPDGQSKVVLSKVSSNSGLVPYEEDSESDVENGRSNGPVPKKNGSPLPSSSSHPPTSTSSSRPPILDGVLDATTSVPGNTNLRTWGGVQAFSPVSHTRHASTPVKRSQSCERVLSRFQSKAKPKGTGSAENSPRKEHSSSLPVSPRKESSPDLQSWSHVSGKDFAEKPLRQAKLPGSGSPSTSKPVADSGLNGKRVVSTHCGWLVKKEERDASTDAEVASCNGGHSVNGNEQGGGDSQGTKFLHRNSSMPSAGGNNNRARVPNGPSMRTDFSHGDAGTSTPNGHVDRECRNVTPDSHRSSHKPREIHTPFVCRKPLHYPQANEYDSNEDVSDLQWQLEESESISPAKSKKHKKHKKHKKRRYQEGEEEEFSESRLGHKKHKKKKHKHKEHRDREESSHHHTLHNGTDLSDSSHRGGKKSTASSESEEYEWVERTKDSITSAQPQVDQKDESAPTQKNKCPPPTEMRKSAKEESLGVMEELERNHNLAYGKPVYSWDGNLSSLSQDRVQQSSRKRLWEEDYEDEMERAKIKKYKRHNEKSHHARSFNPFQRAADERVRADKPHHSGSHRPTSFANMDESYKLNSHSSHGSSSSYRPGYPSNGIDGHRASSHPSDRHSVSGMSSSSFYGRHGSSPGFLPWRKGK